MARAPILRLHPVWSYVGAKNWLIYTIANQRLLIISTFPRRRVESLEPADITRAERTTAANCSSNIIFAIDT